MRKMWFIHRINANLTSGGNTVVILSDEKTTLTLANGKEYELAGGANEFSFALVKGDKRSEFAVGEAFAETDKQPREVVDQDGNALPIGRLF